MTYIFIIKNNLCYFVSLEEEYTHTSTEIV